MVKIKKSTTTKVAKKHFQPNPKIIFGDREIQIIKTLAWCRPVDKLAEALGVDVKTFYAVKRRQPEIQEAYDSSKLVVECALADAFREAIKDPNQVITRIFLAKCLGWRETSPVPTIPLKDLDYSKSETLPQQIIAKLSQFENLTFDQVLQVLNVLPKIPTWEEIKQSNAFDLLTDDEMIEIHNKIETRKAKLSEQSKIINVG